jgi:hypothetical protein
MFASLDKRIAALENERIPDIEKLLSPVTSIKEECKKVDNIGIV